MNCRFEAQYTGDAQRNEPAVEPHEAILIPTISTVKPARKQTAVPV